jgi:hypothetical protein
MALSIMGLFATFSITTLRIERHYAKCHYAECPVSFMVMLNVVMLIVVMLNVVMLNVVMLNVVGTFQLTLMFTSKVRAYPTLG